MGVKIEESLAMDDSCQVKFWARGHIPWGGFIEALERHIDESGRDIPHWVVVQAPVCHLYQRSVPYRGSTVGDTQFFHHDKPSRGAYPVTVMEFWFPLHAHRRRAAQQGEGGGV